MGDIDADIRALESRLESNTGQIGRLTQLCGAILKRTTESANAAEIDGLRGELAKYRHEIKGYERDSAAVMKDLKDLRKKRTGSA